MLAARLPPAFSGRRREKGKGKKSVKPADKPDSVHRGPLAKPSTWPPLLWAVCRQTARCHLPASSAEPPRYWPTWCCCAQRLPVSPELNRLVSVAL